MSSQNRWPLLLVLLVTASGAQAQDFDQDEGAGPSTLELSFSNPGARSMGLGGAFAALADDATAAFANPAGLVQLTRSEISAEGRRWSYSTPFTAGGRITGEPTGIGLDSSAGIRKARTSDDVTGHRVEYVTITGGFDPTVIDPELTLDDADELHLGVEYVFAHKQPIFVLRLGAWLDPDHLFRFSGGDGSLDDTLARAIQTGGDDELHVSAGVGIKLQHLQVDLAVDLSDLRDTASLSAIYSF